MNRKAFSIIEALSSAAVLAIICAYVCSMSAYSNKLISRCYTKYTKVCRAESVLEMAKGTSFELLESNGDLIVSEIDADTKKLSVLVKGFQIDAIRSRFN